MSDAAHLWLFFGLVFGIVILPGMDMAFVLGSALVGGRRTGLCAVAGLIAGGVCHVVMGASGLAVLLALVPSAFNAMLVAGALYVAWIGWGLCRVEGGLALDGPRALLSPRAAFTRAAMTNLMNPKAYVFMLAVFPQFIRPEKGSIAAQAVVLGAIIAATQAGVYGTIAWLADGVRGWLGSHPGANRGIARTIGALLVAVAALTALEGWRSSGGDGDRDDRAATRSQAVAWPARTPLPRR
jgi:threonine/homoserine/homoserine lactone efflux protein